MTVLRDNSNPYRWINPRAIVMSNGHELMIQQSALDPNGVYVHFFDGEDAMHARFNPEDTRVLRDALNVIVESK